MAKTGIFLNSLRQLTSQNITAKICIVGAGPAGFYAAQQILKVCTLLKASISKRKKNNGKEVDFIFQCTSNSQIDILEKLPVPYGLVRYGVAPDHPEVKNVINTFEKIAKDNRVRFLGNVNIGRDITIQELKELYHAVLLVSFE